MSEIHIRFKARPYQKAVIDFFRRGGKQAFEVWHRKAGKDRTATFIESELAFKRVGLYWHALPKYEDARKVIWDAITPEGDRLIDVSFPDDICRKKNAHEMKIELLNGSIWQPIGADNFNSLVGASPVHVTYSEYALMHPHARQFIRPAIAQNNGSELFITTPRGYNHAYDDYQYAVTNERWHTSLLTVDDTRVLSREVLEEERRTMPDELFRQEYYCDFSAANVGAILGRYIEVAEREGRITDEVETEKSGALIEISGDIGFRDAAAWWWWQPRYDGFALLDYDEDIGLDAQEWIPRLEKKGYKIGKIWLPHDAMSRHMAWKRSVAEQFAAHFGFKRIGLLEQGAIGDRINAARTMSRLCYFNRTRCAAGLSALRAWQYAYDEELRVYSKNPQHDWASNGADAFSYGCQVMKERKRPEKDTRFAHLPKKGTMEWLTTEAWKGRPIPGLSKRPLG